MIEDVYEPLARYRDEFREKFSTLTREKFRELAAASGVDVEANRRQVRKIGGIERRLGAARRRRACLGALALIGLAAAIGGAVWAWRDDTGAGFARGIALAAAGAALGIFMAVLRSRAGKVVRSLEREKEAALAVAWAQMAKLNELYTWDITVRLIERTVPRLAFDPFFTASRLDDLRRCFAWDDSFNEGKSIVFAQSGAINGNPFALGEYVEQRWGEKTYTGTREISWFEMERDGEGRLRRVTRHQTLCASVTRPVPEYVREKVLIYGNDAAPDLSFSRRPSSLSSAGDGLIASLRKRRALGKLKAFSRNLDDESQYTLMTNHEFETLFCTMDRDNEVQFRLLFSPLAQQQMLRLLKDRDTGFGDDFSFTKRRRINFIAADHLKAAAIDTDPGRFRDWDFDRAARVFQEFNESYFRNVYFAFAPLLTIPAYQQTRSHEEIWKGVLPSAPSAFWEHESIANYYGEAAFRHPNCVTGNILKTRLVGRENGVSRVAVTAHGYRGEKRVAMERVYGGDGRWHEVPVEWIEYLPVERTREMLVAEGEAPPNSFRAVYDASPFARRRRSIFSFVN